LSFEIYLSFVVYDLEIHIEEETSIRQKKIGEQWFQKDQI